MIQLYNTQGNITSNLMNFFEKFKNLISKPINKMLSALIFGSIKAESIVATDIAKNLKEDFSHTKLDSTVRRIERFSNNKKFNGEALYDNIIKDVIKNYVSKNKNIYISFDHMYCKDKFTILMFTLKIGKQGIPLWYRCFEGKSDKNAFSNETIISGIDAVSKLFSAENELIFLADRWFTNTKILSHIDSLNHTYCVRSKGNIKIDIPYHPENQVISNINCVPTKYTKSTTYNDVYITDSKYKTNIAISPERGNSDDMLYVLTNGDSKLALKHYGYRFGSIEFVFKNQKSNGLYLESTNIRNIQAFKSMYTVSCITVLWLSILGGDYCKNQHSTKFVPFRTSKRNKTGITRIYSLFNTGLMLFNLLFNSEINRKMKFNFKLHDL